jgi:broad specificity phosphatase PhoE
MRSVTRRTKNQARAALHLLSTRQLLALHERAFGRLESRTRERLLMAARLRGWDRTWDDPGPEAA